MTTIYTDEGASHGNRTRFFRQSTNCIEWIWLDAYMSGSDTWFKMLNIKTIKDAMFEGIDIKQVR